MNLDKKDINIFLTLWIKNDPELWSELRPIQIRLLVDRIVKEKSYREIAQEHGAHPVSIKNIIEAILVKIDRYISTEVAKHLRVINAKLDARPEKPFEILEIYLN